MGQKGQLDRVLLAHTASVTALDWCNVPALHNISTSDTNAAGLGWILSGGLDRTVKVFAIPICFINFNLRRRSGT